MSERVKEVKSLYGTITVESLPSTDASVRWTIRRKAELVAAINGDLLSAADACARYGISEDELLLWSRTIARHGEQALRVTRIQNIPPAERAV